MIADISKSKELIDSLIEYQFLVGVVQSQDSIREGVSINIFTKKQEGINNAELLYIHENGSPMRNLPSRPVLAYTIEWAHSQLDRIIDECIDGIFSGWTRSQLELHLRRFAIRIQNYAQNMIMSRDPRLAPNQPATIAGKGSDLPLFDTGELARSITAELTRVTSG